MWLVAALLHLLELPVSVGPEVHIGPDVCVIFASQQLVLRMGCWLLRVGRTPCLLLCEGGNSPVDGQGILDAGMCLEFVSNIVICLEIYICYRWILESLDKRAIGGARGNVDAVLRRC